ncbi:leucyl aminopeptidase [Lysinibacillus sphaericus]|uniref:Probable cytosol aminopeptidase n=1 Tax=Lysinibacillus sphaericus OT4b.31 TaxID=1285586 RepID=R7ZJR4_LYSSH|nr:leucyl aminopeptidase [Lysinibacillus sphaericus]EON74340.1 cytosol aminopeptidase [Lysinibacillus sphaericus OT4b.31]
MHIVKEAKTFETIATEVLVVGVTKHREQMQDWASFSTFYGDSLNAWLSTGDVSTDLKKITKLPFMKEHNKLKRILFVGLDERKNLTEGDLRAAFGLVGKELRTLKVKEYSIWLESFTTDAITVTDVAFLAGEGTGLGYYSIPHYKTTSNEVDQRIDAVHLVTAAEDIDEVVASYEVGIIYANAVNEARSLINLPPNLLTATDLANYAETLAAEYDLEVEILDKAQLEELGMGGILSVNQGSIEEPRLITLKYKATEDFADPIGLVGKGVTYDTGGYSLKPKDSMVGMKGDMGGAAAVLGAMKIIGELRPNKNVVAVIGSTDNMVSGLAFKPDDVITMYSGKTVEILNTDAEGRLVLADATTYAKQQGATALIDVATLTGGVITALGMDKTGALANNDEFYAAFMEATQETDEFVWRLPLTESDKKRIRKSDVADLNNSPGRDGHMIFGGGFVGEFVGDTPWIHLDIAGTSDAMATHDLGPKGGTGVMVRTLANFVQRLGEEK